MFKGLVRCRLREDFQVLTSPYNEDLLHFILIFKYHSSRPSSRNLCKDMGKSFSLRSRYLLLLRSHYLLTTSWLLKPPLQGLRSRCSIEMTAVSFYCHCTHNTTADVHSARDCASCTLCCSWPLVRGIAFEAARAVYLTINNEIRLEN